MSSLLLLPTKSTFVLKLSTERVARSLWASHDLIYWSLFLYLFVETMQTPEKYLLVLRLIGKSLRTVRLTLDPTGCTVKMRIGVNHYRLSRKCSLVTERSVNLQMAMSSLGSSGAEVDYMQRDGVEGSGSGNGADFEDNDEEYNTRGSGSGYGPISEGIVVFIGVFLWLIGCFKGEEDSRNINPIFSKGGKSTMRPPTAPTGEASTVKSSLLVSVVAVALARLY